MEDLINERSSHTKKNYNEGSSTYTDFTEVEAIDVILKVIALTDMLHSKKVVHTNLNP